MKFGETLQAVRNEVGLSQAKLALKAELSVDSLRHWEQGRALPNIIAVTKLARALGVSLDRLAAEEEEDEEATEPEAAKPKKQSRKGKE